MKSTFKPYEGEEPYIFVSYARKDKDKIFPILEALNQYTYRIWYDAGIHVGEDWKKALREKIDRCTVFVAFLSDAFLTSEPCFEEATRAEWHQKMIVPIHLDEIERAIPSMFCDRQDLRYYNFENSDDFVKRLEQEKAFFYCRKEYWQREGEIEWGFDPHQGILTIVRYGYEKYEKLRKIPVRMKNHADVWNAEAEKDIGSTASWMEYREKIKIVEIKGIIQNIGDRSFKDCTNLTSIMVSSGVVTIGISAFWCCEKLTSIKIPDSVTAIGEDAFFGCTSLTSVEIPSSVNEIGPGAFEGCTALTTVTILGSMTSIARRTFAECVRLTSVTIPDGVKTIGNSAFVFCASLTEVKIPDSVTKIECGAFMCCEKLTSVEIPADVILEEDAFPEHTKIDRRSRKEAQ